MNLYVETGHPDAGRPLLAAIARALATRGVEVVIAAGEDNLIRARQAEDPGHRPFVVVAAGLPNLVHEFAHLIQAGVVADDHGFDYGQIPLDLTAARQRRWLWEELACAVVSCAYGAAGSADAWFKEQIEIQGVFYGIDGDDPPAFVALVEATIARHPGELTAVVDRAHDAIADALVTAGAADADAKPPQRLSFVDLWARYRATMPLPAELLARG